MTHGPQRFQNVVKQENAVGNAPHIPAVNTNKAAGN